MSQEPKNEEKDLTFEEFLLVHQHQLESSCVPQLYWTTLFKKLKNEIYDAGEVFQIQCVQEEAEDEDSEEDDENTSSCSWRVVVNTEEGIKCIDKKHIYLVDHAWTYRVHEARDYLNQVAGLKERMAALMDVPTEGREQKKVVDDLLKEMWKFNNTYSLGNYELGTNERLPIWYVMDEFGSRIQHSDMPTFKMAPFMYGPQHIAYSIIWPVRDLEKGEEVTRDYVPNIQHPGRRKAMLLPWIQCDFKDISYEQPEPEPSFFSAHRIEDEDTSDMKKVPPLPTDRKLKVCLDYPQSPELTDSRFELVESGEEADIIWTRHSFKDYKSLYSEGVYRYINQFPSEQCLTVKDLLPIVCRRAGSGKYDPETLEGSPKWLPVSYNLNTEMDKFVSYFQHREEKGLDNVWILKPWNLSNSADITVSDNLNQIIRFSESGPKIACKYISDTVTIHREDIKSDVKVDFRFLVFLASVKPLKLWVYKPFSVRRGHKQYELTDYDDFLRHLTYVGLYEYKDVYRPGMYTEQFIEPFEAENPGFKWEPIEASIHQMFLEVFQAATSKAPPAGMSHFPLSRAIYGIDLLLQWSKNEKGEKYVQPMLSEVNFACDYTSWMEEYPEMLNDAFSVLFFNDIKGREDRIIPLS
ncbi:tubulin--tyrosine ligase-like protein 12 [Mercenaria mercenaria]|uniref:tubulin--tyrosine ligase-like protein 12 n=1 Tax=Mercenaria mercenaria TaxID=6596 RepID=UPI00234E7C8C|nr:tubulin--tyrosine ligase-like protein 12 [Mercenaria mercenaria]